jgi:N-acetylneuraminate epimerase
MRLLAGWQRAAICCMVLTGVSPVQAQIRWKAATPLPTPLGYAGMYAAGCGGWLLAAGGTNFPGRPPNEGGTKFWSSTIYGTVDIHGSWKVVGSLPRPAAYGVFASYRGDLICAGGSDSVSHFADCYRVHMRGSEAAVTPLPSLPTAIANGCGALMGSKLYLIGGQVTPDAATALNTVYVLDLAARTPRWEAIRPLPGSPRILAQAALYGGSLYVIGGAMLVPGKTGKTARIYLNDAYRLEKDGTWTRIADLPRPRVAAPSPVPAELGQILSISGDSGDQVDLDPKAHRGFDSQGYRYDPRVNRWEPVEGAAFAPVTAPLVWFKGHPVIISGECRPGVRSPEVWEGYLSP